MAPKWIRKQGPFPSKKGAIAARQSCIAHLKAPFDDFTPPIANRNYREGFPRIFTNLRPMGAGEVGRAWFERVWQQREVGAIHELCAAGAVGHLRPCDIVGPEAFEQLWHAFFGAFPDLDVVLEDLVTEGDKVVARWRVRGTHMGDGLGFPPTGKRIEFTGMTMLEVQDGKIVEGWDEWDFGGLMAKLASE